MNLLDNCVSDDSEVTLVGFLDDHLHCLRERLKNNEELKEGLLMKTIGLLKILYSYPKSCSNKDTPFVSFHNGLLETAYDIACYVKKGERDSKINLGLLKIFELLLSNFYPKDFNAIVSRIIQVMKVNFEVMNAKSDQDLNIMNIIVCICNNLSNKNYADVNVVKFLGDSCFHSLIVNLCVSSSNKSVSKILFSSVIPTLINLLNDCSIVSQLWCSLAGECMKNKCEINQRMENVEFHVDDCLSKKLSVLCVLADYFLPVEKHLDSFIVRDDKFWSVVYCGLINLNPLLKKQSLYLAKRAIDYLVTKNSSSFNTGSFVWHAEFPSRLETIWMDVFVLFEVLDEKQFHLVKPVLPCFMKIIFNKTAVTVNGEKVLLLHDHWILCICERIFNHDSNLVVKWGLTNMLNCDNVCMLSVTESFIRLVAKTFNNTSLFAGSFKENCVTESELEMCLQNWFNNVASMLSKSENVCRRFFNELIKVLNETVWAPVPLFNLVKSLSRVESFKCLNVHSLKSLKKFIKEALRTQNVFIRGAIQCLLVQCIVRLTDVDCVDVNVICDLLSVFESDECFKRGTNTWINVTKWLKTFIDQDIFMKYINSALHDLASGNTDFNAASIARFVLLLNDANLFCSNLFDYSLFMIFKDCFARPYINLSGFDNLLLFLLNAISESQSVTEVGIHEPHQNVSPRVNFFDKIAKLYASDILLFIKQKLSLLSNMNETDSFEIYFSVFNAFYSFASVDHNVASVILQIVTDSYCNINNVDINPLRKYFSAKIICLHLEYDSEDSEKFSSLECFIETLLKGNNINEILLKEYCNWSDVTFTRAQENQWKKIVSGYVDSCWNIFYHYTSLKKDSVKNITGKGIINMKTLFDNALEAIQVGGRETLLFVNKAFKIILPLAVESDDMSTTDVIRFINSLWKACFELRKLDVFWDVFKSWVEMTFQQLIIINDSYSVDLIEFMNRIFDESEYVSGLSNMLLSHLCQEITEPAVLSSLSGVLIRALVFGPVHRKDLRTEYDTCLYIKSCGAMFSINQLKPMTSLVRDDRELRLKTLNLLITCTVVNIKKCNAINIKSETTNEMRILIDMFKSLMAFDDEMSKKKQRYFNDSLHHRIKNRVLQSLLMLQHVISYVDDEIIPKSDSHKTNDVKMLHDVIVEWIGSNLCKESQQPSIRYQLEWLLIRCILRYPEYVNKFWEMFIKGSEERAGSVCSFISVAYHLAAVMKQPLFFDSCIQEILPWCMAQHFNIRLYAQVALIKLLEMLRDIDDGELYAKYMIVEKSLSISIERGTCVRNAPKLISDFYFSVFHPITHFSLKSLYDDLPRLAGLSPDECVTDIDVLSRCFESVIDLGIVSLYDNVLSGCDVTQSVSLSSCQPASWTVKVKGESCQQDVESDVTVIQKKFVPWNMMLLDSNINSEVDFVSGGKCKNDAQLSRPADSVISNQGENDLILVASLIDKAPNLGGLSRTCEVFGVKQLVLNNLHYINDKQFTVLSMSSEKHINLIEVKQFHLREYLTTMKRLHCYTLVGAEQTASGVKLNDFRFPAKTLLLLGNEKEGIPASLLPLMDVCVEIPQYGFIRSLNVHVTGAIFLWEYTKQHRVLSDADKLLH